MTTKTKAISDRDAMADLHGEPRPDNPTFPMPPDYAKMLPEHGRVTVERSMGVLRDVENGCASYGPESVRFVAERGDAQTIVRIEVHGDTKITLTLDDLVEIAAALCPPWLLRKKLGL
jgi:hypothetical protein